MQAQIDSINSEIASLRQQIIQHSVYRSIQDLEDLQVFMQYHVYAVWDFMSLLKTLQNGLTCTTVPWLPVGDAETRSLINEIVAGEESDINDAGGKQSHFEMYLDAMTQIGCDMEPVQNFILALRQGVAVERALEGEGIPKAAREFVTNTFDVIEGGKLHEQAAVFTFGREDLIPNMFLSIINDLNTRFPESVGLFKYYLDRHIEVDGDHHSHLALRMTSVLCGDQEDKWVEARQGAIISLQNRLFLWDAILEEILANRANKI
ncbi:DUF3050 domain-containing protein [Dyadobacter tibetensis]|uniref:DUF3050 domain-containing protein n=1 Tax=Dyadobacter tibetensis TaxID=1211851 RepID=UPI000470F536|nr:DUF3050 domain-containing protein [Dyadobacter tibetensis]